MIDRQELLNISREMGLEANVVEKDYALGWLLAGIHADEQLRGRWVFKGGTCLKKCYFETYRFSEDLDFTVTEQAHFNEVFLKERFASIAEWIREQSGLDLAPGDIRFEVLRNPRGGLSAEGRVPYRGPLGRAGDAPRIKLDLTTDEIVVRDPEERAVFHPYTDEPEGGISAICYPFDELFAEKIRALHERLRPRDLYDVIYIFRNRRDTAVAAEVLHVLGRKCEFKQIVVPTAAIILNHEAKPDLEASWDRMLGHQLPALPSLQDFLGEIPAMFDWLVSVVEAAIAPQPVAITINVAGGEQIDTSWVMPERPQVWGFAASIEEIRFAALNRLCVDLGYQGSRRLIEPYAIRRSQAGNYLLYAVKSATGESRSYRLDRIQSTKATSQSFKPRYPVEIAADTSVASAPPVATGGGPRRRSSGTTRRSGGYKTRELRYVFRCPMCQKLFRRSEYDAALNSHKNKQGWPCYGTYGVFVKQEYS